MVEHRHTLCDEGKTAVDAHTEFSRRERQIMDAIYARGQASATQVMEDMPEAPSRTALAAEKKAA